ncbi:PRAME family member 6 [Cricetulus griseus]|uniref:PRAME family member 6 n=1 Tax=Cricetulus griseus TaxID=10029 RepID=G3HNX8_CRIGR|nr:PRAME family member 6 [Cricetulus griseus]
MQNLLLNDASTISTLEYLPINLFPPVFKEAFTGRHTQLLKAMVAAWPFSYLPMSALMKTPNVELLQDILGGVDILQAQKVRPRWWRLGVLDLRNVNQDFWDIWAMYAQQRLWAQERKDSVQLYCVKIDICAFPGEIIKEVLDIFPPDDIEELELFTNHILLFPGHIASHFGHMTKLRKIRLTYIFLETDTHDMCAVLFLSQFSKSNSHEQLSLDGIYFPHRHMQQLLSCLKTPSESLSITRYLLTPLDFKHLSQCQRLCQLKHGNLSNVIVSGSGDPHL